MEIVEAPPVISLMVMVLIGGWGFIGGPTVFLPAFLMYFMVSSSVASEPIAQDAVSEAVPHEVSVEMYFTSTPEEKAPAIAPRPVAQP